MIYFLTIVFIRIRLHFSIIYNLSLIFNISIKSKVRRKYDVSFAVTSSLPNQTRASLLCRRSTQHGLLYPILNIYYSLYRINEKT